MELTENQTTNFKEYFLDISKLIAAIYVFTSLSDKPVIFFAGLFIAIAFLIGGLLFLEGREK